VPRIDEIIAGKDAPVFSFEFFPPKSDEGEANLRRALRELSPLAPDFVSVTYGAGGTTRDRTVDIVASLRQEFGLEAMAHFTCVNATVDDLRTTLDRMRDAGVENVLALRGDPPEGQDRWTQTEGGLEHSSELVGLMEAEYGFAIGAACFPETHIDAVDAESDLRHLRQKVDAGARFLITQLFFDNTVYDEFVVRARDAGIDVPIIPGIMPITNVHQIKRITALCGSEIPARLRYALESRADEPEAVSELGVAYATLQCAQLLANGAPGVHFYTLNRSPATRAILGALRLMRPWERTATPV
jgi:methylenetetrahydrofolate reductase (NADPH)